VNKRPSITAYCNIITFIIIIIGKLRVELGPMS